MPSSASAHGPADAGNAFHTKLTTSQYRQCWADHIAATKSPATQRKSAGDRPIRDDLTFAHRDDSSVAGHIVPRPLIPPHAEQPPATAVVDPFLSSRNMQKIEALQAALVAERSQRVRLEKELEQALAAR